jgi:uncharacterized protein YndB with AHSA1/START domain
MHQEAEWKKGGAWKMVFPDGRTADAGEVLECDPPKRLVLKWRNEFRPEVKEEGYSRCVYDLEFSEGVTRLTITHSSEGTKLIEAVSGGWPKVLASLKSLLETGEALGTIHKYKAA